MKFTSNENKEFWNEYAKKYRDNPFGAHTDNHVVQLENNFSTDCYKEVMVIFNEKADMDFKNYVESRFNQNNQLTDIEHLICLFQFCYTIACAQYHIPGFRHNDIKPNNLLITLNKNMDQKHR